MANKSPTHYLCTVKLSLLYLYKFLRYKNFKNKLFCGTPCTTAILEQEFAHFGYPHTLVTDNATTFMSQEFQAWCKQRGIVHLTGAPYHPATNGAAERLIQSFKQALRKSSLPPKEALQEFLMQYRRIPFASGLSPSELLNGRRIRTKIDTLVPSIPHLLQGRQSRQASKHSNTEDSEDWFRKSNIITH